MDGTYWHGIQLDVWHQLSSILFLMTVLIPAAIGDYQHQKIPNWLTMSGWIIGPLLGLLFAGLPGLTGSLLGLGFMVGLMFPLWVIHWFGAADVKLLGSVGAVVGFSWAPKVLLGVMVTGLVFSLAAMAYRRRLPLALHWLILGNLGEMMKSIISRPGEVQSSMSAREQDAIPYAIPIAFGTMLTILYLEMH